MPLLKHQILNPHGFTVEERYSPNKTSRLLYPLVRPRVVLFHHTGSENFESPYHWFLDKKSRVSADFLIGRDGRIVRMVPKGYAAWHAGECIFAGKVVRNYNHLSYGLELVNLGDGREPYPKIQLEAAAYVVALIQFEAPTVELLRRHGDVCYPQGRKSDPKGLTQSMIYSTVARCQPHVTLR